MSQQLPLVTDAPRTESPNTSRTWAQISLSALQQNCAALQNLVREKAGEKSQVCAVVKADAYGHGAVWVARQAQTAGIGHFAVASVAEVQELRQAQIHGDIYLLGSFLPHEAETLVRADAVPMLSSPEQFRALHEAAKNAPLPARAFLMLDTGMGREGMLPDMARQLWQEAAAIQNTVRFVGIATHFSSADETDGLAWTNAQVGIYREFVQSLPPDSLARADDGRGGRGIWLTLCNSPATLGTSDAARIVDALPPESVRGTLFRAGLLLYGIEPCRGMFVDTPGLVPLLSWRARVTLVREMPEGATIGYGRTATLTRPSRIATLGAGYADGVSRRLGNRGSVVINGQALPIVGRISMDQCQVDVTGAATPVRTGDTAVFIGRDGNTSQTILDLAELIDTTPHEPTCLLTRRVPRLYRV